MVMSIWVGFVGSEEVELVFDVLDGFEGEGVGGIGRGEEVRFFDVMRIFFEE